MLTAREAFRRLRQEIDRNIISRIYGDYSFDENWDLAIILDACRYDLAKDKGSSHDLNLGIPERMYSVGSHSSEWIPRTFRSVNDSVLKETAYITGNPHSEMAPDKLGHLDEVWRYAWDDKRGRIPPRPLTDQTIRAMRRNMTEKYIVHYMQPHLPPLESDRVGDIGMSKDESWHEDSLWNQVRRGELDQDVLIEAYQNNLTPVLDDVKILLENVDAQKVVITADHGNYLGEWGIWEHPPGHIHPAVRNVPWWVTSATDYQTHQPEEYSKQQNKSRREKLQELGYIE